MNKTWQKIIAVAFSVLMAVPMTFTTACDNADNGGNSDSNSGSSISEINGETYTVAKNWGKEDLYTHYLGGLGEGVMPVGGFGGPYTPSGTSYNGHIQPDFNDDRYWQIMQDCGVNNIVFTWNEYRQDGAATIMRALDQAQKYGMTYFVRDNAAIYWSAENSQQFVGDKTLAEIIAPYINHPACAGIFGRDEPGGSEMSMYGRLAKGFYELGYEGKDVYMNLLPNYAGPSVLAPYSSYEAYVRGYLEECSSVPYLSYDFYPFTSLSSMNLDKLGSGGAANYFSNLALIRNLAEEYELPFWGYVLVGELHTDRTEYPIFPTKEAVFWNINTLLAYGAKGLQYFSLIQSPIDNELSDAAYDKDEGKNYTRFGIVGGMGNVNQWYYYAVEIKDQIQAIDEILMDSQNMGVFAVGDRASYLGTGKEVITSCKWRELQSVDADNAIVGCFDHEGSSVYYVVNNDFENKQKITLNFDNKYGYDVIQRGKTASVVGESLTLTVETGEGVLVKLRTK